MLKATIEFLPDHAPAPMIDSWEPMRTVLAGLEAHPHVQRIGLPADFEDAWQVGLSLVQLLPLDENLKLELLAIDSVEELMRELDIVLNALSGEE